MTEDLIKSHESPRGKILNALDFPLPLNPHPHLFVASELYAWVETQDNIGCEQEYPTASSRWGLAATAGAFSKWHIDCDGFATYVQTKVGAKWWVVIGPPVGQPACSFAAWRAMFVIHDEDNNTNPFARLKELGFRIEAICLIPGTELYVV
jgi:hypothetical protein